MLKTKNRATLSRLLLLAAAVLLAGCAADAPRALLEGRRLLDQGQVEEALPRLEDATARLKTNALAWSYLGLAYHRAGRLTNAVTAYRTALHYNYDLAEVRFNLGSAFLELGRPDLARPELTAYTLRRPRDLAGWQKLGTAQLRPPRDLGGAEKSFGEALKLHPRDATALNGLGLVHLQRGRPREAAQYFSATLKHHPQDPVALRNLAVVAQVNLNNRALAIESYRQYAALMPPPPDAEEALAVARQLEAEIAAASARASNALALASAATNVVRPVVTNAARPAPTNELASAPVRPPVRTNPPTPVPQPLPPPATQAVVTTTPPAQPAPTAPTNALDVVQLSNPPAVKVAEDPPAPPPPAVVRPSAPAPPTSVLAAKPKPPEPEKRGFWSRVNPANLFTGDGALNPGNWFGGGSKEEKELKPAKPASPPAPKTTPLTPVNPRPQAPSPTNAVVAARPPAPEPVPTARYPYHAFGTPATGDRRTALQAFNAGVEAHRQNRLSDAVKSYRQAVAADASYYDAHYNLGVALQQARDLGPALRAYEAALAVKPDSLDARYNFALALRDGGYLQDAAAELERVLAASPAEPRALLALGNLYGQRLRQIPRARACYLKLLDVEPQHPQGASIRLWLAANPG